MSDPSDLVESKQPSIQVIARAAAILRALGNNAAGLSLSAIANIVKLPRSTVPQTAPPASEAQRLRRRHSTYYMRLSIEDRIASRQQNGLIGRDKVR